MDNYDRRPYAIAADIGAKISALAELPKTTAEDCERLNTALAIIAAVAQTIDGRREDYSQEIAAESGGESPSYRSAMRDAGRGHLLR